MGTFLMMSKLSSSKNRNSASKDDWRGEKAEGNWLAKAFYNRIAILLLGHWF